MVWRSERRELKGVSRRGARTEAPVRAGTAGSFPAAAASESVRDGSGASTVSRAETRTSGSQSPIVRTRSLLEGASHPQMWELPGPAPELTASS